MASIDLPLLLGWSTALAPASFSVREGKPNRDGVLARLWDRYRAWHAQRLTVQLLHSLDCGTLRDIGISTREIESLVYADTQDRIRRYDPDWWRK
jgi:uncharacterized protein YjiS (DUF1127 family)